MKAALVACLWSSALVTGAEEAGARHLIYLHGRIRFAVLAACLSESIPRLLAEQGRKPAGRVLSIREKSDETSEPCPAWSGDTGPKAPLVVREIRLDTGLRHGFLYRPLREWVEPVVDWAHSTQAAER